MSQEAPYNLRIGVPIYLQQSRTVALNSARQFLGEIKTTSVPQSGEATGLPGDMPQDLPLIAGPGVRPALVCVRVGAIDWVTLAARWRFLKEESADQQMDDTPHIA